MAVEKGVTVRFSMVTNCDIEEISRTDKGTFTETVPGLFWVRSVRSYDGKLQYYEVKIIAEKLFNFGGFFGI